MGVDIDQWNGDLNHSSLQWIFGQNIVLQQDSVQMAIPNPVFESIL